MVKRIAFIALMAVALVSSAAFAGPQPGDKLPVTILEGVFTSETGKAVDFQVGDGGFVRIVNREKGLSYQLGAKLDGKGGVELTLRQYGDDDQILLLGEEKLYAQLGGRQVRAETAPFQIALKGSREALAKYREGGPPANLDPSLNYIECCVSCDGWLICCGINLGEDFDWICCEITTDCFICTICEWWAQ